MPNLTTASFVNYNYLVLNLKGDEGNGEKRQHEEFNYSIFVYI